MLKMSITRRKPKSAGWEAKFSIKLVFKLKFSEVIYVTLSLKRFWPFFAFMLLGTFRDKSLRLSSFYLFLQAQ
jgi:hypothetical protein